MASYGVFSSKKEKGIDVPLWIMGIMMCLGCLYVIFSSKNPKANDQTTENAARVTVQQLQNLAAGDFVELQNGQILVVPKVPKSDQFLITLAEANYKPEQRGIEITARQTKRIVKTTDPDWPETARKFLGPNKNRPAEQPN